MPTTVVKEIGSGGDYTTLQAWEDACPADLRAGTGTDQIWQGQIKASTDGFTSGSTLLTISGTSVDTTHYLELTTKAGASFRDNANVRTNALKYNAANGCYISCSAFTGYAISISGVQNCRFSNLQIEGTSNTGCINSGGYDVIIDNCIFAGDGNVVNLTSANTIMRNSLINCTRTDNAVTQMCILQLGTQCYNCTFIRVSDGTTTTNGFSGFSTGPILKNCAFFGVTNVFSGGSTPTCTTCYTDVASPPTGFTTAAFSTAQFTGITAAAKDYRLSSGSALIDTATTDTTNASNDISGYGRPSGSGYDVGCWEFTSAGGAADPVTLSHRFNGFGVNSYGMRP